MQKYNRPFDIVPVGAAVDTYPRDYKIKYEIGFKGKLIESPLDLHLRTSSYK